MKQATQSLAAVAMLAMAGSAAAVTVNVGGLDLTTGPTFGVASVYENVITATGQELSGFGEVTQINGVNISDLCAGCELTYRFGGYEATSLSPTGITFDGGWVNFYLGVGGDNDFNPFASAGSAADLAAATNGALFLTLAGHDIDAAGNTFSGIGRDIGTTDAVGFGAGLLDVDNTGSLNGNTAGAGALANAFFDTNGIAAMFGGAADFQLGASFSSFLLPHPGECPGGAACLAGSIDIRGNVAAIPEPETYALMLAGLGIVGFVARRRKR
jgi:hypothetical protein